MAAAGSQRDETWRAGWLRTLPQCEDFEKVLSASKALGFQALIATPGRDDSRYTQFEGFAVQAARHGLETYAVLSPVWPEGADRDLYAQRMSPGETALLEKLKENQEEWMKTHQHGGEPLGGQEDLFRKPMPCFHQPAVREATIQALENLVREIPSLTGIAFDGFGYQNYRNCFCEESLRQQQAYHEKHPKLSLAEAEEGFALDSLVGFINELARKARGLRPEMKTTIHIWPVYLPEPLYGNRLDLDYCGQTVAWFFPPYWPLDKIAAYTRKVVGEQNKHFPRARGIPFLGIFLNKKSTVDKPLEQFRQELRTIFDNDPSASLMIHEFEDVLDNPLYFEVIREEFARAEEPLIR
jgi:hypothetical protein